MRVVQDIVIVETVYFRDQQDIAGDGGTLFGAVLVLVPLILKPRIGQFGSLACAILLAFSPSLIYYSRFARNDIFMAVFTLALVGVMWRYIDERKNRWLYVGAAIIALGFTTKETQYIVIAVLGAYLLTQVWVNLKNGFTLDVLLLSSLLQRLLWF